MTARQAATKRQQQIRHHFLSKSAYTDIFLYQLIQFYSNNAINLHHSTTVLTYKMVIVLRP